MAVYKYGFDTDGGITVTLARHKESNRVDFLFLTTQEQLDNGEEDLRTLRLQLMA